MRPAFKQPNIDAVEFELPPPSGEELARLRASIAANGVLEPIVVSAGRGWQVINESEHAPMRAPLFAGIPEPVTAETAA